MSIQWTNADGMVIRYGPRLKCEDYPEIPEPDPVECPTVVYEQAVTWKTPENICLGFGPVDEASTT